MWGSNIIGEKYARRKCRKDKVNKYVYEVKEYVCLHKTGKEKGNNEKKKRKRGKKKWKQRRRPPPRERGEK